MLGAVLALVVLGAATFALLRDTIERNVLQGVLARELDAEVTIAGLRHEGDSTVLDDMRIHPTRDDVALDLPTIRYRTRDGWTEVTALHPHARIALDERVRETDVVERFVTALRAKSVRLRVAEGTLEIRVRTLATTPDATAARPPDLSAAPFAMPSDAAHPTEPPDTIVDPGPSVEPVVAATGDLPRALTFAQISGTWRNGGAPKYAISGDLLAATGRYPIAVVAPASSGSGWKVTAERLPLAALFIGGGEHFWARSGLIRALAVRGGRDGIVGSAQLDDASVVLDGHRIDGLAGPLAIGRGALGSPGLAGTFANGVPVSFAGEIHDIGDPLSALAFGTADLVRWERAFAISATQAHLRSLRTEVVAPGVAFAQYAVASTVGPHVISAVLLDPREKSLRFDTAISGDHIVSHGGERTSDLAARTGAIAGVNGDYFDIARTYEPQGLLLEHGRLLRGPADRHALVIDRSGKVTFAEFRLVGAARTAAESYAITQLNTWPVGDATIITPEYGPTLPPAPGVTFAALTPTAVADRYRIASIAPVTSAIPATFGLAFGPKIARPLPKVGDSIAIHYGLDPAVPGAVTGIGGGPRLLRDGEWYEDPHAPAPDERDVRWPVVALASLADGTILLAAVDGRHPERSVGMTRPEFAALLRSLGAVDAMALDSGGSVTLVGRAPGDATASVRNRPSDDSAERYISDAIFAYSSAPVGTLVKALQPSPSPSATVTPIAAARVFPTASPSASPEPTFAPAPLPAPTR